MEATTKTLWDLKSAGHSLITDHSALGTWADGRVILCTGGAIAFFDGGAGEYSDLGEPDVFGLVVPDFAVAKDVFTKVLECGL